MSGKFIPNFHLVPSSEKLKSEWCRKAVDYYWSNSNVKSLLWDKKIDEIESYASGDISMVPYKTMYKSLTKKAREKMANSRFVSGEQELDVDNLIFQPEPLIQNKINSAIALTQKIPTEITCTAIDAAAMKKKKEDIQFLKNKPALEQDLQDIADQMDIGEVDLGTTKHSSTKFGDSPLGLNLMNPDDEKVFSNLIYALRVETAMEKALEEFKHIKNVDQIRLLETKDQYKYAVSTNRAFQSSTTGLPDAEYLFPGSVYSEQSQLPDYSDKDARFIAYKMSVNELFNFLGSEIKDEAQLELMMNGDGGYAIGNKMNQFQPDNFNTQKVSLLYCEVKSPDYLGIYENPKSKRGLAILTDDEKKITSKIWGQNTYTFFWLQNTKYFFKIETLPYAAREKGKESFSSFSINIYKSNSKSAVELSIGSNVKAQIAAIKLNYELVMAKANGIYIDIHGLRNAADGLTKEKGSYTTNDLLTLALERNVMIADTQGFEGKNDGQFKPIIPIEGGLKNIDGFLRTIATANQQINQYIGTNDSLTGMSTNPDALIGVEKLRIDASVNALYYVSIALEQQAKKLYNVWGNIVQYAIEEGGKVKEAMVNYIGKEDVELLDGLNEMPLHTLTLKVTLTQREEERAAYNNNLNFLKAQNAITIADEYILSAITNPKQRFAELAAIQNRYQNKQDAIRQEQFQQQQQLQQQQSEGMVAVKNAETEGDIKVVYAKGDVQSKIAALANDLGIKKDQMSFLGKRQLQRDRGQDQVNKALTTLQESNRQKLMEPMKLS